MAELEKHAWWNLCVALSAVALFAALWIVTRNPAASMGAFGILGLWGMPFFRLRRPAFDERDREIDRKSMIAAMSFFWILIVIGVVGMGFALGWNTLVQARVWAISGLLSGGCIVIQTAKSVASIRMYRAG